MFGYVTIYRKGLADADMDRYQAYYCGLCRALGRRYGRTGQLALSYDMAFVAILLTALYDVPTAYTAGRCAPHPIKPRPRANNEFMDYAADMTAANVRTFETFAFYIPLAFIVLSLLVFMFTVKIDEKMHERIVIELEEKLGVDSLDD